MSERDPAIRPFAHLDPAAFRAAVERTSDDFDFRPVLVEKDYFCSLVLQAICPSGVPWVFKGGTCLSKVYTDFYRLSEDLDFCIPVTDTVRRTERRRLIDPAKNLVGGLPGQIRGIELQEALSGRNVSTQYVAAVRYRSVITGDWEKVKIEIGMREPLMRSPASRPLRTLLRNAFTGAEMVPPFNIAVMDLSEALAEKTRAALTRREPAIRDFFDLDFAVRKLSLSMNDPELVTMVRQKVSMPGNGPVQLTQGRRDSLERQRTKELGTVLKAGEAEPFDLDRIWQALVALAERLKQPDTRG